MAATRILESTETTSDTFAWNGTVIVSVHGTFTGDGFVYIVPADIPEADRPANWVKCHSGGIDSNLPVIELDLASGYLAELRMDNAGGVGYWAPVESVQAYRLR